MTSRLIPSSQAGITAGGAQLAAAGLLIAVRCQKVATGRLDDLGSVQDGLKMSMDGQPNAGLSTVCVERLTETRVTAGETAPFVFCGEPERAGSHHDTRRAVAPGRRPEGRGRKHKSTCVAYGLRKSPGYRLAWYRAGGRVSRFFLVRSGTGMAITANPPVLNFCGPLDRWSFPSRIKPSKQPRGVFTVFLRPAPSVRVAFHKRQSNQGWTACLTKGFPKSVKEFPRTI